MSDAKVDDTTQKTEDATQKTEDATQKTEEKPVIQMPGVDLKGLFSGTDVNTIMWFLAVYFAIIVILAIFFRDQLASAQAFSGQIIDILVFGTLVYYAVYLYYKNRDKKFAEYLEDELRSGVANFDKVIYLGILLIGLTGITYAYKLLTLAADAPFSLTFVSSIGWIYMSVLLILNFFKHILGISLLDNIFPSAKSESEEEPETKTAPDEVFNVSNNLYTYDDAKSVCSSYGARLANYDEIEEAYNKGAEWCNYGWSDGQMAFFPTQKDTWSVLQRNKARANDCGRPGVNGGYMANPHIKFGVNCYGKKPVASEADLALMNAKKASLTPAAKDATEPKKEWKDAVLNSFNKDKWSAY
jgi:hypothetical protein